MMLALIRHGQTDWNLEGRLQGNVDIPLNDTGREQARVAAAALAGEPWDLVVSSTLGRARETAEIIAGRLGLEVGGAYEEFREQAFGEGEGVHVGELADRWPTRDIPGKEPDALVGPRGLAGLERVRAEHAGARVLVVAHGTLIRHTLAEISGHSPRRFPRLENATSSLVRRDAERWRVLTVGGAPFEGVLPTLGEPTRLDLAG